MAKRKRAPTLQEIADRSERQAFWTAVMRDDSVLIKDRLAASNLLAKSAGDYIERHEHSQAGPVQLTLTLVQAEPRHD